MVHPDSATPVKAKASSEHGNKKSIDTQWDSFPRASLIGLDFLDVSD
jgi:hypothetical protein